MKYWMDKQKKADEKVTARLDSILRSFNIDKIMFDMESIDVRELRDIQYRLTKLRTKYAPK